MTPHQTRTQCLHLHPNVHADGWTCPACGKRGKTVPSLTFPERVHDTAGEKMKFVVLRLFRAGMDTAQIARTLNATVRQVLYILKRGGARTMRNVRRAVTVDELQALENTFWVVR